jgi:CTP synthase (UTP-ammonia lyase)
MTAVRIALVGDYDPAVTAHQAIPLALAKAGAELGFEVVGEWVATETLAAGVHGTAAARCQGIWCVPASPYRSEAGALLAIRHARERRRPFLGTCGGFQHALLEYARHVLGLEGAAHAESEPGAPAPLIVPLACSLVEASDEVLLVPGSRLARAYGADRATETYHCRYGLDPGHAHLLDEGPLRIVARDRAGEVRAVELDGHPFFIATLFQPERAALAGRAHPLITAFAEAAARTAPEVALR